MPAWTSRVIVGFVWALSGALIALLTAVPARAQTPQGGEGAGVELKVLQWGAGGVARPGGWIGVQVQVTDLGQTTREVLLELEVRDPDGDTTLYQGTVAVGGERKPTWIYARLPFSASVPQEFVLTAHAVAEPSRAEREAGVIRAGALLGRSRFNVPAPVGAHAALFGVVGRNLAGMKNYSTDAGYNTGFPPMSHERVEMVGMTVASLPDRWMGLSEMEAIVWTGTGPEMEPTDLPEDRARAIREWVMRGGHLVVVLPPVGQAWTNPAQPLFDIFPKVTVQRLENVDLNPYRPLLSDDKALSLPTSSVVQILEPAPGAKAEEAVRILAGPDGKAVVTSRVVGSGAVTVVGLDVASRTLDGLNAVQADVFWHRVLGRRGVLLTDSQVAKSRDPGYTGPKNFTNRQVRAFDQDVQGLINKTGQAFVGVMLAFLLFACYWVVAGPLGFWVAKRRDQTRHAWVGFVAVGVVFTGVAWGGATLLKERKGGAQHLTIVDHVYGQEQERAKIWMSVLLSRFGLMDVSIGEPGAAADPKSPVFNTLAPWDPPPSELAAAASSSFADSQPYGINSRAPSHVLTPARSTTKNYVGEWMGGPQWKMPMPLGEDGASAGALSVRTVKTTRGWELDGVLKHELPGTLRHVYVVVIHGQRPVRAQESYAGQLQTEGAFYERTDWKPGEALDLDAAGQEWRPLSAPGRGGNPLLSKLVGGVTDDVDAIGFVPGRRGGQAQVPLAPGRVEDRLMALTFFGVLDPPDARNDNERQVLAQRPDAHRWDLSRWFSRPCVIVVGQIDDAPSPVPLTLDGSPLESVGKTVVRWVYPLPDNPPRITGN